MCGELGNGTTSKIETHGLFLVRHMYPAMKVRESVGRPANPAMRPRKFVTQINTRELIN